ncbi:hypothetical protein AURANDRAFT_64364 [Aureococcus anophagefferens]|uniref:ShKT domain-containing protein n=1 Tax=Aureococcus anophagefferens TaxID=44056 RepID=F0Y9W9_AURAN|nr:hypothetical protein AURANDRAFT_64364 [Aureococcus anophagefferens]EGB08105.1 hypothetical protein AURANDRAFT_64364 [Aureococcus anophagefferens]|eukprot:XP_009037462.1 hypothetical protein AURANDRAFT_64364 [Aureococcus anophagefferens]
MPSALPIPSPTTSPTVSPTTSPTESPTTAPTTTPTTAPTSASNPTPKPTPAPTSSCADSASWFSKKSKNDCAWVAEDAESRCSKKDDDDVKAKSACPRACGKCDDDAEEEDEAEPACEDDSTWFSKKSSNNCRWVAEKPDSRCSKKNDDDVKAKSACFVACGVCEAPEAACADSTSWYYKKADRDCSWIADKPKRCDKADEYGVDASVACALTCDACDADAAPTPAPTPEPTAAPTPAPTTAPTATRCEDDDDWLYDGKDGRGCAWIAEKTSRCDGKDGAREACPLSCGACEPACEDSKSWFSKKESNNCEWVAEKPDSRCSKKSDDKAKAKDVCQLACGTCGDEDRRLSRLRGAAN